MIHLLSFFFLIFFDSITLLSALISKHIVKPFNHSFLTFSVINLGIINGFDQYFAVFNHLTRCIFSFYDILSKQLFPDEMHFQDS